jgi:hypothetical protein
MAGARWEPPPAQVVLVDTAEALDECAGVLAAAVAAGVDAERPPAALRRPPAAGRAPFESLAQTSRSASSRT